MEVSAALAHRRNFIIQVSTHCAGEIFIWNHSKNNNVSTSYPPLPPAFPLSLSLSLSVSLFLESNVTHSAK